MSSIKNLVFVFLAALTILLTFSMSVQARTSYLNDVNSTCGTSYGCAICHVGGTPGAPLTSGGSAWDAAGGDDCVFCPDASACGGSSCTDGDVDGYNVEGGTCGAVDCNDNNASINPGAVEVCTDGTDNDCDDNVDCDDPNCSGDPACPVCLPEGKGKTCSDNLDNDCDGAADCQDAACAGNRVCKEGKGQSCSDGLDNDLDRAVDCDDRDCERNKACR